MSTRHTSRNRCNASVFLSHQESFFDQRIAPLSLILFAVSQLAWFCASAGSTHWAALHHLMEYVEGLPIFKITYMDQLQNTLSYLGITSVICGLHLSTGTCSLEPVFSLIRLVPRNSFKHNPSYHHDHILASAHAPQSQPWQYPWSEIGSQQGWSCWQFQCIESIRTKMQNYLFRKAREQLRYDGGIEPSCARRWFFAIPCQPSCSAVWWGWIFLDFGSKKQQKKCFLHPYNVCSEYCCRKLKLFSTGNQVPWLLLQLCQKSGNEEQLLKEIEWCSEISVIAWY